MKKPTKRNANWFAIALLASVLYAALFIYIIGWPNIVAFFSANTTNLNSIGDFTAGMFAPIAVIWLVAAVQTQRQELADAREQADHARRVVDEQLTLIKSQQKAAEYQAQQTIQNAALAYRLSLYEKRNAIYQRFVMLGVDDYGNGKWDEDGYWALLKLSQEASFIFDDKIEEWIGQIAVQVSQFVQYVEQNPFEIESDGFNEASEKASERNHEITKQRNEYTDWIAEQFMPNTCTAKFFPYMHVSDRPYISAGVDEKNA